ncbi:MAG: NAD(P)/FAD-dependent oxidoreductase [Firmicutes bacterium]|nr:NAD(P)/FAD-dependent oxidoreductase [Bacillota bacterium]
MKEYDVLFIGGGHACWHGALLLKKAGKEVALVEREFLGGTCTNYGCNAKILLDSPVELQEAMKRYEGIGLKEEPKIEWTSLMQYKKKLIGGMPDVMSGMFKQLGLEVIRGEATFKDENTIEVDGETYRAKKFVIGTGQNYIPLDIPGKEYMHDSRDFLSLDDIPEHVSFIGGGIISMEFASICLSLGRKVDIVTDGEIILKQYPQKYVEKVVDKMKEQGANFVFNAKVESIEKTENGYALKGADGLHIDTDYVLVAVGRRANVDGMNLDGIGIQYSGRGIEVDDHMRTSVKHIYASGDVVDKKIPKLTPTAEFESNYIALDILNPLNFAIKYPPIPNLVFTLPRIAQVGVSIEEARNNPGEYRVEEVDFGKTMSWLNKAEKDAHITYIIDHKNHLVGAAVMSDEAGTYMDLLTLIINEKLGVKELSKMIFAFPTTTYGLVATLMPLLLKEQ